MVQQDEVRTGKYRHFKGALYEVIGVAFNVDTQEQLVVYRKYYGAQSLLARPKAIFVENVEVDGKSVPRFRWLSP